jgi:TorA maturation chaperone TorD
VSETADRGGSVAQAVLEPEDQARADFYALLARLYAAAPDAALLRAIAGAGGLTVSSNEESARQFARSWQDLMAASSETDPEVAAEEYQDLFVGVGKSEVSLHASSYLTRPGSSVLADIRGELSSLGLGRLPEVSLFEDHLAAVCETMRALIAGAPGIAPAAFAQQRDFFLAYVSSWVRECCAAISQSPIANYYRRVGEFTQIFMAIERDSFAIE